MTYRIRFSPAATRQLRKLDGRTRRRIQAVVELLAQDPRPAGAKKLVGGHGEWYVRTGNYRIIYEIDDGVLVVLVLAVGHRREVYRRRVATGAPQVSHTRSSVRLLASLSSESFVSRFLEFRVN